MIYSELDIYTTEELKERIGHMRAEIDCVVEEIEAREASKNTVSNLSLDEFLKIYDLLDD